MRKIVILMGVILLGVSVNSRAGEMDMYGLNFNAPTVNNKANVTDPRRGEIILDTSDNTFYGNSDGTTSGWTSLGSTGYQLLTASSTVKTPTGTAQFHSLSGNSLTLTTGKWRAWCNGNFDSSGGSPSYTNQGVSFYGSNGSDSATSPTLLTAVSGLTILSAANAGIFSSYGGAQTNTTVMTTAPYILQCASSCTIYCVTYSSQSTSANSRVNVYVNAERIQ